MSGAKADGTAAHATFRQLYEEQAGPLYAFCLRLCGTAADAEDAFQETLADGWRGWEGFRGDARASTWLFRIAVRACGRVLARGSRRRAAPLEREPAAPQPGPVEQAEQRERARRILDAMGELPLAQRTVLALATLEGMGRGEIAGILGLPVGTVDSRLHQARQRLRGILARDQASRS